MFAKAALVSLLMAAGAIGAPGAPSEIAADSATCSVWNFIASELKYDFVDDYGFCTDYARQSIRLVFHDCFPGGGCDGSIVLSDECFTRFDNENLIPICAKLRDIANRYHVGTADLINLAGGEYNPLHRVKKEMDKELTSLSHRQQGLQIRSLHALLRRAYGQPGCSPGRPAAAADRAGAAADRGLRPQGVLVRRARRPGRRAQRGQEPHRRAL